MSVDKPGRGYGQGKEAGLGKVNSKAPLPSHLTHTGILTITLTYNFYNLFIYIYL